MPLSELSVHLVDAIIITAHLSQTHEALCRRITGVFPTLRIR